MYFLSDMIEDKSVEDVIETNWKISRQDISDCLGPGIFLKVAEEDPHFRVFLFVPKNEADRLFVGLSYNVYGEKERSRLLEADGLLQALARGMTPAQRHRIPQIMQENDFGTALMNQGYWIDMNSESQVAAAKRRQEFKAYEQSPDFHMRLGNLYRLLGLYDDTRREWTAVYQANHDPRLAAFISKLPR